MLLEKCGLSSITLKALKAKKLNTAEEYMSILPNGCSDYTSVTPLSEAVGRDVLVEGIIKDIKAYDGTPERLTVRLVEKSTGTPFGVTWFAQNYRAKSIIQMTGLAVCVGGKVSYDPHYGYQVGSPDYFAPSVEFAKKVYPRYRKIKGVSTEMQSKLYRNLKYYVTEELEPQVIEKAGITPLPELYGRVHFPTTMEDYTGAFSEIRFREMLYFAGHMVKGDAEAVRITPMRDFSLADAYVASLPFRFTEGQKKAAERIRCSLASSFPTKTLVQGDVGCGKTVVAFYALMSAIGSGYQAVLLAPTVVLAKQHYDGILPTVNALNAKGFHIRPEFLSGNMTAKEKKEAKARLASGESNLIIGTHSVFTDMYEYRNLGLVIVDEEHRFGVKQREALAERSKKGLHRILMSATPIPRTLAGSVYGDDTDIIEIKTLPNGRKPVQSCIASKDEPIFRFLDKQLAAGRQAYVVCPLVATEDDESGKASVMEVYERYHAHFGNGIKIAVAHGKLKKQELMDVLDGFHSGQYHILIATTVIEVGVNVPNANVIVIENAEMFGLATLHQLRGRVGRGSYDSYCVFKSEDKANQRLNVLVSTTDGFQIAEEDMKLRGTGDLIGLEQTGFNKYVALSLQYPDDYAKAKKIAKWAVSSGFTNLLREGDEPQA